MTDPAAQGAGLGAHNAADPAANTGDRDGPIPADGRRRVDAHTSDHDSDEDGSIYGHRDKDHMEDAAELKKDIKKSIDTLPDQASNDPRFIADFFQALTNTALRASGIDVPPFISPAHNPLGQRRRTRRISYVNLCVCTRVRLYATAYVRAPYVWSMGT